MLWIILLVVVMLVALSGASYGYAARPMDGPYPVYTAPLGGLASLILVGLVVFFLIGMLNGFDNMPFHMPQIHID